jgi:BMFP domain-containing protein YqiC
MDEKQQLQIMSETVGTFKKLLQSRLSNKVELLNTLQDNISDTTPESIKKMREEEASRVRAVMQEQKDLIDIVNALYPDL